MVITRKPNAPLDVGAGAKKEWFKGIGRSRDTIASAVGGGKDRGLKKNRHDR